MSYETRGTVRGNGEKRERHTSRLLDVDIGLCGLGTQAQERQEAYVQLQNRFFLCFRAEARQEWLLKCVDVAFLTCSTLPRFDFRRYARIFECTLNVAVTKVG